MIACKRDVLPLPPPAKEGEDFLNTIKGITHLMFNPYQPTYRELGRTIAQLGGATQTLALQQGGVIIKIREVAAKSPGTLPHAPTRDGGSAENAGAVLQPPTRDGESEARGGCRKCRSSFSAAGYSAPNTKKIKRGTGRP